MRTSEKDLIPLLLRLDRTYPKGRALFEALARVTVTVAIEAVILRFNERGVVAVLLTKRGPDEVYPNQWHCPGSVMRVGETVRMVLRRIAKKELGTDFTELPRFVGNFNHLQELRGHFFTPVYLCRVGSDKHGTWFPVDALPVKTIAHHCAHVIPIALQVFSQSD